MKTILLTNDDGIYAEGIYELYKELKTMAKIIVAAPDSEKSSVGHGITLAQPIRYKTVKRRGEQFGYGITGTPADCVKFAIKVLLKKKPDLVISGINCGGNDGCSVHYSGTVAAAREGALMGIPSFAISLDTFSNPDFIYSAQIARRLAKSILRNSLPKGTFLNVNVPSQPMSKIKGIQIASQCLDPILEIFTRRNHPRIGAYYWMTGALPQKKSNKDFDTYALAKNYVTIVPILCDLTDKKFIKQLKSWKI